MREAVKKVVSGLKPGEFSIGDPYSTEWIVTIQRIGFGVDTEVIGRGLGGTAAEAFDLAYNNQIDQTIKRFDQERSKG